MLLELTNPRSQTKILRQKQHLPLCRPHTNSCQIQNPEMEILQELKQTKTQAKQTHLMHNHFYGFSAFTESSIQLHTENFNLFDLFSKNLTY